MAYSNGLITSKEMLMSMNKICGETIKSDKLSNFEKTLVQVSMNYFSAWVIKDPKEFMTMYNQVATDLIKMMDGEDNAPDPSVNEPLNMN